MPQACKLPTGRRLAALAGAFLATPALAAAPSGAGLADWLSRNTDVPVAQVAIVAPEDVYSLEPSARLPNGEVIALVRTEVLAADWGAAHGFQSWEANLGFDCRGGRVRMLKSMVYPQPNRQGVPKSEPANGDWFTPKPPEPAAQLLSAACDPAFVWPLRANVASAPARGPEAAKLAEAAAAKIEVIAPSAQAEAEARQRAPSAEAEARRPAPSASASVAVALPQAPSDRASVSVELPQTSPSAKGDAKAPPAPSSAGRYAIQVVYTTTEAGARVSLAQARAALGPAADGLSDVMQSSEFGRHKSPRVTGYLTGFADTAAAQGACGVLTKAKLGCVVRPAPAEAAASTAPTAVAAVAAEPHAAAYYVQIGRGPSAAGAKTALAQARKILGPTAEALTDATDESRVRGRRRYTARLTGFQTASAAGGVGQTFTAPPEIRSCTALVSFT